MISQASNLTLMKRPSLSNRASSTLLTLALTLPAVGLKAADDWKDFTSTTTQNWSAGGSWVDGTAPSISDPTLILNFNPSAVGTTTSGGRISQSFISNNDLGTVQLNKLSLSGESDATTTARSITISGGTLNFQGSGAAITVATGAAAGNRPVSYTINSAINMGASLTLDASGVNASGNTGTVLGSAITLNGNTLTLKSKAGSTAISSAGAISLSGGSISGAGTIAAEGGFLVITSTSSGFTGNFEARSGFVSLSTSSLLGSGNTVSVGSGASIGLGNNNHTWAGINDIAGAGGIIGVNANNGRPLALSGSGTYSFSGQLLDRVNVPGANSQLSLTVSLGTGGIQKLSGANAYSGVTTLTSGILEVTTLANGGSSTTMATTAASGTNALQLTSVTGLTVGQVITANGIAAGTTITGIDTITNTVTLSGTTIGALTAGATTKAGTANALGISTNAASNLLISNGATLRYTGAGSSTDRLFTLSGGNGSLFTLDSSGSGAVAFTNTSAIVHANLNATRTLILTGTNGGNNTLASTLANSGTAAASLTKNGSGKWILTGANTYTGATTVNAGTLVVGVSGVGSLTSAITVNSGTLGGSGSTTGAVTIGDGAGSADAAIAAGNSAGTFTTTSSLSFLSDGVFSFELNGTTASADKLVANGVSINSSAIFSFNLLGDLSGLSVGQTFTIIDNTGVGNISGSFSNLTAGGTYNAGGGLTFTVSGGSGVYGNDLVLTVASVVPEPGTAGLLVASGMLLLRRRRTNREA